MRLEIIAAAALVVACAGPVSADRVIFAPTGTVLGAGEVKAEGAISPSNNDNKVYWAGVGLQRLEVNAMRVDNGAELVGAKGVDVIGLEMGMLPETTLTPGIGIGVWDMTKQTDEGRGYYLAISKVTPLSKGFPAPISDVRVHAGFGIDGIEGAFAGAEAKAPFGLKLSAEYFQKKANYAVGWGIIPSLNLKAYLLGGDVYYGVQFASPL